MVEKETSEEGSNLICVALLAGFILIKNLQMCFCSYTRCQKRAKSNKCNLIINIADNAREREGVTQ